MSKYSKQVQKNYKKELIKAEDYFKSGELERAKRHFERLYNHYSKGSDYSLTRSILNRLRVIYGDLKDLNEQRKIVHNLLVIDKKLNKNEEVLGKWYQELGYLCLSTGELEESEKNFRRSLDCINSGTDQQTIVVRYFGFASLKKFIGELGTALEYHIKSLSICKEQEFESLAEKIYSEITIIYDQLSDIDNLRKFFIEHKDLIENSKDKLRIGTFYLNSAAFYDSIENINREEAIRKALEIAQKNGYKDLEAHALMNMGYLLKDDIKTINEYYSKAKLIGESLNSNSILSNCYQLIGETYYLNKNYEVAIKNIHKSLKYSKKRHDIFSLIRNYETLGMIYANINNYYDSYVFYSQALRQYQDILNNLSTSELRDNFKESFNKFPNLLDKLYKYIEEGKHYPEVEEIDEFTDIATNLCIKSKQFGDLSNESIKINIRKLTFFSLQDQVIKELLEKVQRYKNKKLDKSDILFFLDQFPDISLKKAMLKILTRVKDYYFTFDDITHLLQDGINSLPSSPSTIMFFAIPDDLWNKSNTFWTYFIKKITNKRISLVRSSTIIQKLEKLQATQDVFIVFVDDVIGSGRQFVQSFMKFFGNDFIEKGYNVRQNFNIYLIAAIGSAESYNYIEAKTPIKKDRIRYSLKIDTEDKAFHKNHWSDEKELSDLKNFLRRVDSKHWDGWKEKDSEKGQEYLVILELNTPNNTISCLWKDTHNWKALFPRK